MTIPHDPIDPGQDDPVVGDPLIVPPPAGEPFDAPVVPPIETTPEPAPSTAVPDTSAPQPAPDPALEDDSGEDSGSKLKAGALLAGAAALANKVRQKAPEKVQEIREKRAAGRCVILAELSGRSVAIGPYRDAESARQDSIKVAGAPRVVELVPESSFFGTKGQ